MSRANRPHAHLLTELARVPRELPRRQGHEPVRIPYKLPTRRTHLSHGHVGGARRFWYERFGTDPRPAAQIRTKARRPRCPNRPGCRAGRPSYSRVEFRRSDPDLGVRERDAKPRPFDLLSEKNYRDGSGVLTFNFTRSPRRVPGWTTGHSMSVASRMHHSRNT